MLVHWPSEITLGLLTNNYKILSLNESVLDIDLKIPFDMSMQLQKSDRENKNSRNCTWYLK